MEGNLSINIAEKLEVDIPHVEGGPGPSELKNERSISVSLYAENSGLCSIGVSILHEVDDEGFERNDAYLVIEDGRFVEVGVWPVHGFSRRFCIDGTHTTAKAEGDIAKGQAVVQYEGDPL
ncbi:MAG: hypothetical protein ACYS67_19365, partial [Planctomycetota bacterium]